MRSTPSRSFRVRVVDVSLVQGVAGYMADEMNRNCQSAAVTQIRRLNREAERIWEAEGLDNVLNETTLDGGTPVSRLDATTVIPHDDLSIVDNLADIYLDFRSKKPPRAMHQAFVEKRMLDALGTAGMPLEEGKRVLKAYRRYHRLKVEAFGRWARKVRPAKEGGLGEWLRDQSYGDGEWDHKPKIRPVWGAVNRLGNEPVAYGYDVWSNLHYGYVGHAAGFSLEELVWGSEAAQQADTGEEDDLRDQVSISEGYDLYEQESESVSAADLVAILDRLREDGARLGIAVPSAGARVPSWYYERMGLEREKWNELVDKARDG